MNKETGNDRPAEPTKTKNRSLLKAAATLFVLSFKQFVFSRRTSFILLLAGLPVLLALPWLYVRYALAETMNGYSIFSVVMVKLILSYFTIIVTFLYGNMAIAGEINDGTLFYILTRPVPKSVVVLAKYLSLVCSTIAVLLPPLILSYLLYTLPDGMEATLKHLKTVGLDAEILVLAALAYGAVFIFLGTALKKALVVGILYAVLWETLIPFIPFFLRKLTIAHYLHSISPHISERNALIELFGMSTSYGYSVLSLLIISAVFLCLTIWVFRRKEYLPSEQG
jgi:ABC-2 type transport system permease protein